MILLYSNTIIYLSKKFLNIDDILEDDKNPLVSIITYMEVFGFGFQNKTEIDFIKKLFSFLEVVYIDEDIARNTIKLRQKYKIKLPDAIICATAIQNNAKLITSDEKLKSIFDNTVN